MPPETVKVTLPSLPFLQLAFVTLPDATIAGTTTLLILMLPLTKVTGILFTSLSKIWTLNGTPLNVNGKFEPGAPLFILKQTSKTNELSPNKVTPLPLFKPDKSANMTNEPEAVVL